MVWLPSFHRTVWVKLLEARSIFTVMLVLPAVTVLVDKVKLLARGMVFRVTFPETVRSSSLDVSPCESKKPFKLMVLVPSAL